MSFELPRQSPATVTSSSSGANRSSGQQMSDACRRRSRCRWRLTSRSATTSMPARPMPSTGRSETFTVPRDVRLLRAGRRDQHGGAPGWLGGPSRNPRQVGFPTRVRPLPGTARSRRVEARRRAREGHHVRSRPHRARLRGFRDPARTSRAAGPAERGDPAGTRPHPPLHTSVSNPGMSSRAASRTLVGTP